MLQEVELGSTFGTKQLYATRNMELCCARSCLRGGYTGNKVFSATCSPTMLQGNVARITWPLVLFNLK